MPDEKSNVVLGEYVDKGGTKHVVYDNGFVERWIVDPLSIENTYTIRSLDGKTLEYHYNTIGSKQFRPIAGGNDNEFVDAIKDIFLNKPFESSFLK